MHTHTGACNILCAPVCVCGWVSLATFATLNSAARLSFPTCAYYCCHVNASARADVGAGVAATRCEQAKANKQINKQSKCGRRAFHSVPSPPVAPVSSFSVKLFKRLPHMCVCIGVCVWRRARAWMVLCVCVCVRGLLCWCEQAAVSCCCCCYYCSWPLCRSLVEGGWGEWRAGGVGWLAQQETISSK